MKKIMEKKAVHSADGISGLNNVEKARAKLNKVMITSGYLVCGISIIGAIIALGIMFASKNPWLSILGLFIFAALFGFGYSLITLGKKGDEKLIHRISYKIARAHSHNHDAAIKQNHPASIIHHARESTQPLIKKHHHTTHKTRKKAKPVQHGSHRSSRKKYCLDCGASLPSHAKFCANCGNKQE